MYPPYKLLTMKPHDDTQARLILPEERGTEESRKRMEAWLRGYISFSDLCRLEGWNAAERRQTLEGLGVKLPEWCERAPHLVWRKELPTAEGYYWLHDPQKRFHSTFLVYFHDPLNVRVHGGAYLPAGIFTDGCLWAGAMPMPKLPEYDVKPVEEEGEHGQK